MTDVTRIAKDVVGIEDDNSMQPAELIDFRSLSVAQVIQMFPDFRDYLAEEVTNSDSLLTKIPFVQEGLKAKPLRRRDGLSIFGDGED